MPWKRLALVPFGILLGLLVLEGVLQLGALVVKRTTRGELPAAWITGNLRVLCLGDSNTYGLWLPRDEAYPQQLEALWNERIEAPKLEVLNLGVPGTNSSRLVRDLPRLLETLDPDLVILMVGVNDFWTLPFPLEETQRTRSIVSFVQQNSRIYRLYRLIRHRMVSSEVEIIMDPDGDLRRGARHKARVGDQEFDVSFVAAGRGLPGDGADLRENLRRLVGQARDGGTPLYLMTYPSRRSLYALANRAIAAAARDTDTPLIDLAEIFAALCPSEECPDRLFSDGHPRASGHRIVAEAIVERLAERDPP